MHSLGARGVILGDWETSQAPFWVLWGSLGYLFRAFGGRLGSILEALGDPWVPFWGLWASRGCLWGSLGAPLVAQGAQSQIFPIFSLPFWGDFGFILEVKTDPKSDTIFDCFFDGVLIDLNCLRQYTRSGPRGDRLQTTVTILVPFWPHPAGFCSVWWPLGSTFGGKMGLKQR